MVAVLGYSREQIFAAVKAMYTTVADMPTSRFHFPVGASACRLLGYPAEHLEALPEPVVESFAGVGCPFRANVMRRGDIVLDIGAGTGADTLIASRVVGPDGYAIALDLTPAMTRKLHHVVARADVSNVGIIQGSAENLPMGNDTVDCITTNGALNLIPAKRRAVNEMFRVLRPGGRLQIADVVIKRPVTVDCSDDPRLWVECVVGATVDEELVALFRDAGFNAIETVYRHDYFAHSPSRQTREVAAGFGAYSVELSMHRARDAPGHWRQWLRRLAPGRLFHAVRRRGLTGLASLAAALLTCYGGLAAVTLLPLLGIGFGIDQTAWAGAIMTFTLLACLFTVAGAYRHRSFVPAALAIGGAALIAHALFVDYRMAVELAGFALLATATGLNLRIHRRAESRILGLDSGTD